ncbi:MAG: glycerol-3-phosphate acyltransferase [Acidimicrobiia bacterium]
MTAVLLLVPVAYLLGTFPAASLVARASGHDVLEEGSRNPGASNVYRLAGWKAGLLVLLADIGKGAVASGVGLAFDGHRGAYILGLAAVLGHVLPATRRFRGGRGVATAGGALVVVFPLIGLGLVVVWFLVARVLKKASVASIVVVVAFPVAVAITGGSWFDVVVPAVLAVVILARHLPNLRRLLRGQEHGLGGGPAGGTVRR